MLAYLLRRLAGMIPTLLIISVLIFFIIELPPGDYLSNQIEQLRAQGESASIAQLEFLRKEFALDAPFWERYGVWIGLWPGPSGFDGILQGNYGWSFEYSKPVDQVVSGTLLLTVILNFATVLFVYIVSFPIGIYSATRQYSWGDYGFTFLGYIGLATPNFLLGLILLFFMNEWFGVSIGGLMAPQFVGKPLSVDQFLSVLAHLVVPTIVIGTAGTAAMIRRLRANLLDELHRQYVTTARAKGLSEARTVLKYPLRMALNPFISDIGNLIPSLVSGSVIVSVVLNLPTVGPVLLGALQSQDQYLAGFILLFVAVLTLIGMLVSDVLLALLDPRIRLGQEATS
ncbi:ABC transporter permease [Acuticoccus sp. I52.16.1]|uniref:ABC transporter permease n=1 Tax=Acuticoccus sp. I52.16.1 TaxID=2928472 RepID=UPI001FD2E79D|nr:ABC transporter permease [Acuticoccus sp. I52.16.1]UOM34266.1 ABC transporter permease [Acuticoccus sp. I52.16.1]